MNEGPYPNHLSAFMRALGMTDPGLARKLGVSKQQIFNLRRGHRKLTVEWAKRIAPHLEMSWQELITGPPSPPADQTRADLLAVYETMSDEQRRALLTVARVMTPGEKPGAATGDPPTKPQPTSRRSVACILPGPRKQARR